MSGPDAVESSPDRVRQLTRGLAAATAATLVALASHVMAGGAVPGLLGVAVPLFLSFSVCSVLAGVRMRWLRLSVSVAASQAMFHLLFVLGAPALETASARPLAHAGHHGTGVPPILVTGDEPGGHLAHAAGAMWLAHAVAGVVTVLALRHGEVVVARIAAVLRWIAGCWIARAPRPAVIAVRPAAAATATDAAPVLRVVLLALGSVTRRGPPSPVVP